MKTLPNDVSPTGPPIRQLFFNGPLSPWPGLVVVQTDEGYRPASQNELMRCAAAAEAIRQHFHNLYDLLCETEGTS
jgi:hypothetical protein